jgi:hypothetical protein
MNSLLPILLLLILGVLFAATQNNSTTRLCSVTVLLLIVIVFCYLRMRENFSNFSPIEHSMGKCGGLNYAGRQDAIPITGNYDNLRLNSRTKPDYPLVSDVTIFSPVGDGIKLTSDPGSSKFPSVDGKNDSPRHLFMLAHNQSKPECCPSTFSSSLGCVCMSQAQRDMINQRGSNKTHPARPSI